MAKEQSLENLSIQQGSRPSIYFQNLTVDLFQNSNMFSQFDSVDPESDHHWNEKAKDIDRPKNPFNKKTFWD